MSANQRYLPDRSWMLRRIPKTGPGVSSEFESGVEAFLDFAFKHASTRDGLQIRCPCRKCANLKWKDRDNVTYDLYTKGFVCNYTRWTHHGESILFEGQTSASVQAEVPREKTQHVALGASSRRGKNRVVRSGMHKQISLILSRYRRIQRAKAHRFGGGAPIDEATVALIIDQVGARNRDRMLEVNKEQIRTIVREMIFGTTDPLPFTLRDIIRAEVEIICRQMFAAYVASQEGHAWPQGPPSGAGSEEESGSQSEPESDDHEPSSPPSSS